MKITEPDEALGLAIVVTIKEETGVAGITYKAAVSLRFEYALLHHFSDAQVTEIMSNTGQSLAHYLSTIMTRRKLIKEAQNNA